jgi:hypothetical protein
MMMKLSQFLLLRGIVVMTIWKLIYFGQALGGGENMGEHSGLVGMFKVERKTPGHNIRVKFLNWKLDSKHNESKLWWQKSK